MDLSKEGIRGHVLKRVDVDSRRGGGIFTLPGLMTATANGVDTSPVVRGSWVLENIFGTPPAPPPPDVEPLPTDTRLAKTIRDQLALHRKHAACNNCHQKIDPIQGLILLRILMWWVVMPLGENWKHWTTTRQAKFGLSGCHRCRSFIHCFFQMARK